MAAIREVYQTKKDKLQSGLFGCKNVTAAADYAMEFMDTLLKAYHAQEPNVLARQEAAQLFAYGKENGGVICDGGEYTHGSPQIDPNESLLQAAGKQKRGSGEKYISPSGR